MLWQGPASGRSEFGGCLAYVLAKTRRLPLFYQRDDFGQTEIAGVSVPRASI
jgi:uncharacterized protein with PIN domain